MGCGGQCWRGTPGPGRTLTSRGTIIVGPASLYWVLTTANIKEQEALLETVLEMVYGRSLPLEIPPHPTEEIVYNPTSPFFKSSATEAEQGLTFNLCFNFCRKGAYACNCEISLTLDIES